MVMWLISPRTLMRRGWLECGQQQQKMKEEKEEEGEVVVWNGRIA